MGIRWLGGIGFSSIRVPFLESISSNQNPSGAILRLAWNRETCLSSSGISHSEARPIRMSSLLTRKSLVSVPSLLYCKMMSGWIGISLFLTTRVTSQGGHATDGGCGLKPALDYLIIRSQESLHRGTGDLYAQQAALSES